MNASASFLPLRASPLTQSLTAAYYHVDTRLSARHEFEHVAASPAGFGRNMGAGQPAATEILFGPYRLLPAQFLLLEGDTPVRLGSRALEILIVLLERPGELVSKQYLMSRVWPNVFVEAANLTVHMSHLRRILQDGQSGNRFIINIPGRGYSFVGEATVVH